MSSGSWTFGDFGTGPIAAMKQWSGTNGKYETWQGGIRTKWNSYTLVHHTMTQDVNAAPFLPGDIAIPTISEFKTIVGWSANDDLRLLNKLAEAVKGHSFDLGINLAEASKTYGTILKNLRSVGSALLHLKHGNLPAALRDLGSNSRSSKRLKAKDLSGRWLETQYAFLPLIGQSYEAGKALRAISKGVSLTFHVSSGPKRYSYNISPTGSFVNVASHTYSKSIRADIYEELSLPRSLGLTNPAAIVWELVPWSFVVDWFLPVGSYLSAWGVIPSLKGRFLTSERGSIKGGAIRNNFPGWLPGTHYEKANRRDYAQRVNRTPSNSLSVPYPTFNRLPRALSPKRLLNAVALIHQRLR
jgi:hypothetical protein